MPIGYIFWGLMILWLIFGPGYGFVMPAPNARIVSGSYVLLFILLAILGYQAFGSAIK